MSETPDAVAALTARQWQRWTRARRLSEARPQELWAILQQPQLPVPAYVVRAKARLMRTLVTQLGPVVAAVEEYRKVVEDFFASLPAAQWARTLPIGNHGGHCAHALGPLGGRPWAVGVVSASAGARRHRARDVAQRQAAGRPLPLRLRHGVAVRGRSGGVPLAARASGRGCTTTSSGRGATRIARPSGP
jgi:hypothetical protein